MSHHRDNVAISGNDDTQSRRETSPGKETDSTHVAMLDRSMKNEEDITHVNFKSLPGEEEVVETLPLQLKQKMYEEQAWLYPDDMLPWHGDLRGKDAPRRGKIAPGRHTKATVAKKLCVTFRWDTERYDIAYSVGNFDLPADDNPHSRCVRMNWITHSQLPGLVFTIRRGGDLPPAKVWLFTNSFAQMTDDEGNRFPKLGHLTGGDVLETADPCLDLAVLEGDSTVWETWFCLWSDEEVAAAASDNSPVKPARPQVTGISQTDLDYILVAGYLAEKKGDLNVMSPGDWALWGFLSTVNIQVTRTWNGTDAGKEVQRFFVNYMYMHMSNVLTYGDWPHYVRQAREAGKDIYASNYSLRDVEPPRNMVTSWSVKYQDGEPVAAQAERWAKYLPIEVYPTSQAQAFGRRLATERAYGGVVFLLNRKVKVKTRKGKPRGKVLDIHEAAARSSATIEPRDNPSAVSASLAAPDDAPQDSAMKKAGRKRGRRGKQYRKVPDGDSVVAEQAPSAQEELVGGEPAPPESHEQSIRLTSTDGDNMDAEKVLAAQEAQAEGKSAPKSKSGRKRGRRSKHRYYEKDPRETCLFVNS